jgi:hypothetical protein
MLVPRDYTVVNVVWLVTILSQKMKFRPLFMSAEWNGGVRKRWMLALEECREWSWCSYWSEGWNLCW